MAKRKRSLLLRIWYSMVVVPIIMFFVFAQGVNRTIGNPEYYQQQIRQRRLGEVLSSRVPEVLGKSLPLAQNVKFDPQWTEDTLSSLIKGTLDYLNGKTREPHFPVDLGPVYNQLPEPIRSGQLPMPGLAQFAALAKAGKVDLVSQYRDSKLVQQLLKLEKYITIGKMVEYILAAVVIATILLTLLLIKEKRRILALLGGPLMAQGLVLAVFLWVSHRIYLLPGAGKALERYSSSWTFPFVQVGVDIFFNFIKLITALSVYIAVTGAVMLLAEWALRSAASRPRVSSRESGVGSVRELPV